MVPPEVVLRGSRVVALVLVSLASAGVALLVEDHAPFPFPPGRLSPCRIQAGDDVEHVAGPGVPHVLLVGLLGVILVGGAGLDEPDVVGD